MGRPAELTKDYLVKCGITEVTKDGHVFMGNIELRPLITVKPSRFKEQKYHIISFYDPDLYLEKKNLYKNAGMKHILLSRLIYAWFNGIVPACMDVDHINDDSLDDRLDNLQLLTRAENLAKRKGNVNQYGRAIKDRV